MKSSSTVGMMILRIVIVAMIGRFLAVVSSSHYYKSKSRNCISAIPPLNGGATSTSTSTTTATATTTATIKRIDSSVPKSCNNNTTFSTSNDNDDDDDAEEEEDHDRLKEVDINQESKRRKIFLNRIAKVSSLLLRREHDAVLEEEEADELEMHDPEWGNEVTPQSDLTRPGRHIHIVTTASLPWFTGTAVNPLLRAAYLHQRLQTINKQANMTTTKSSYVTLIIPWLELPEDQEKVYNGMVFTTPQQQETYVRGWLRNQAGMPDAADNLQLHFYNARYHAGLGSVFAMGDIIQQLPQDELDVCVLEEPEHVNWFRAPGQGWTKRYNYVVGIVHTNYDQYATQHYSGLWTAPAIRLMSAAMIRAYCHKVIKLSDVVQVFAPEKEVTMNVHGVREEFIVKPTNNNSTDQSTVFGNTTTTTTPLPTHHNQSESTVPIYFIGKLLWTKGLDLLLEYEEYYRQVTGDYFPIEIYGSGPDQEEMIRAYHGRLLWWKRDNNNNIDRDTSIKEGLERVSKNVFVRLFAWVNSRRRMRKNFVLQQNQQRQRKSSIVNNNKRNYNDNNNNNNKKEELYHNVMDVIESIPETVRESLESLPVQGHHGESLDPYSSEEEDEDVVTKTNKTTMKQHLPAKARRALNQLVQDLSTTPIPKRLYELRKQPIPAGFPGRVDHAELKDRHKIFVNPSVSEVLCTTTAEALAMNKFAIIPLHPSNQFFLQFPNCLPYRTPYEFVANLQWALTHDPIPLSEDHAQQFTWEAATDRFLQSAAITHREAQDREKLGRSKMDERIAWFHNELGKGAKGDILRNILGAGPVANQVKYLTTTQQDQSSREDGGDTIMIEGEEEEEEAEGEEEGEDLEVVDNEEEEDEGLSRKFHDSAFVKAIREAFENGISTAIE